MSGIQSVAGGLAIRTVYIVRVLKWNELGASGGGELALHDSGS